MTTHNQSQRNQGLSRHRKSGHPSSGPGNKQAVAKAINALREKPHRESRMVASVKELMAKRKNAPPS